MQRVLAIGLDGYEESVERRLIAAGEVPTLARVREQSARYLLDHGPAQRTGLAWEHVSTGLAPERANRWAAVHFDPQTYAVWQEGTRLAPFAARLKARTVVFDAPYFDLTRASLVRGLVGWGAHDPGVPAHAEPANLLAEFDARFGAYPAAEWIYGHAWPSVERARRMGEGLVRAAELRGRAARWLLGERLPDWDLALVVVSEPHSVIEGLWHGIDASHPLHGLPSASPARDGVFGVYRAVDRLVGVLTSAFPDAAVVVFSMGGMGPNRSDIPSMVLLPELMYRLAFRRPHLRQPQAWRPLSSAGPQLAEEDNWSVVVTSNIPPPPRRFLRRLTERFLPATLRHSLEPRSPLDASANVALRSRPRWMPAFRYQPYWPKMRAFALPSFYDGRIRINLVGRERNGLVPASHYHDICSQIEAVLYECRDAISGDRMVDFVERAKDRNPLTLGPTESDLVVVWQGVSCGLDHPSLGRVGPIPFRRTGGHTGRLGMVYIGNAGLHAADHGVRSSFDVVPTLIELLGEPVSAELSGRSLLPAGCRRSAPTP